MSVKDLKWQTEIYIVGCHMHRCFTCWIESTFPTQIWSTLLFLSPCKVKCMFGDI